MQIKSLGCKKQKGLKGQIVTIPGAIVNAYTIQSHSNGIENISMVYMCEMFRPYVVLKACKYLRNTTLYREHGIVLSKSNLNKDQLSEDIYEIFVVDKDDLSIVEQMLRNNSNRNNGQSDNEDSHGIGSEETNNGTRKQNTFINIFCIFWCRC